MRRCLTTLSLTLVLTATALLLAIRGIALSDTNTGEQTVNSLFVTRQDSLIYKLEAKRRVSLFELQHEIFLLNSLSVSPNDTLLAFIEKYAGIKAESRTEEKGIFDVLPVTYLRIVSRDGTPLHTLLNVRRYVWSPEGNSMAYITYDFRYDEYMDKFSTGLWVFEIETGQRQKVADKANELHWATHDNCLYFIDYYKGRSTVFKWDPESGEVKQTLHKDIYFSPDGKYYLRLWKVEYKPVQLYSTASNDELFTIVARIKDIPPGEMTEILPQGVGALWQTSLRDPFHGWIPGSDHLLLFIKEDVDVELAGTGPVKRVVSRVVKGAEYSIFDVEEREVVRRFSGKPTEWIGNGKVLVLERDGKLVFERLVPED